MKLEFREKFVLEIPLKDGNEEIIDGTIRELTKSEQIKIKKLFETVEADAKTLRKKTRKFERLNEKLIKEKDSLDDLTLDARYADIDLLETECEVLTNKINDIDLATMGLRERFNLTIESDKKERLQQICEDFGYAKVLKVISEDVEAKKPKE